MQIKGELDMLQNKEEQINLLTRFAMSALPAVIAESTQDAKAIAESAYKIAQAMLVVHNLTMKQWDNINRGD